MDRTILHGITILFTFLVLLIGGLIDFRFRIIPDWVPIALVAIGLFTGGSIWDKAIGAILPAAAVYIVYRLGGGLPGGGDIKLYMALGFNLGIQNIVLVLSISLIVGMILALKQSKTVKEKLMRQKVPMGFCVAIGYLGYVLL